MQANVTHSTQYGPQTGTLPEFDTAHNCRLRQAPSMGITPPLSHKYQVEMEGGLGGAGSHNVFSRHPRERR
jgi:hypothetical protein